MVFNNNLRKTKTDIKNILAMDIARNTSGEACIEIMDKGESVELVIDDIHWYTFMICEKLFIKPDGHCYFYDEGREMRVDAYVHGYDELLDLIKPAGIKSN